MLKNSWLNSVYISIYELKRWTWLNWTISLRIDNIVSLCTLIDHFLTLVTIMKWSWWLKMNIKKTNSPLSILDKKMKSKIKLSDSLNFQFQSYHESFNANPEGKLFSTFHKNNFFISNLNTSSWYKSFTQTFM